jgi:hypothetical protein
MNPDITLKIILAVVLISLAGLCLAQTDAGNTDKMMPKVDMAQMHMKMGTDYFNQSWELLDKPDRTKEDEDMLINMAHASMFHWMQVGKPVNMLRGEWLLAHVYTILKHKEEALYHAKNTLDWAKKAKAEDWDLAYAYEAMARAQALNGNKEEFKKYYQMAMDAGKKIKEEGDKKQFDKDMNDNYWFGMK